MIVVYGRVVDRRFWLWGLEERGQYHSLTYATDLRNTASRRVIIARHQASSPLVQTKHKHQPVGRESRLFGRTGLGREGCR